jgi:hypothetical protein
MKLRELAIQTLLFSSILVGVASAERPSRTSEFTGSTSESNGNPRGSQKIIGLFEFRPSVVAETGDSFAANAAEAGYQFSAGRSLAYRQEFFQQFFERKDDGIADFRAKDGYVKAVFENVWSYQKLSLNSETHVRFPTDPLLRSNGLMSVIETHLKLKTVLNRTVSFTIDEAPIVHFYNRAGGLRPSGPAANPVIENQLILLVEAEWPRSAIKFSFPVNVFHVKYADYRTGAKYNNSWQVALWIYPEVTYAINPTTHVGVAFMSDNFLKEDLSGFTPTGFNQGIGQAILKTEL